MFSCLNEDIAQATFVTVHYYCNLAPTRTTITLAEDALIAARNVAQRQHISLGDAVSELIRRGAATGALGMRQAPLHHFSGRFALLPARSDEMVTTQHVRDLMEREGI